MPPQGGKAIEIERTSSEREGASSHLNAAVHCESRCNSMKEAYFQRTDFARVSSLLEQSRNLTWYSFKERNSFRVRKSANELRLKTSYVLDNFPIKVGQDF